MYIRQQENEEIWDGWVQEMIDLLVNALNEVDAAGAPLAVDRTATSQDVGMEKKVQTEPVKTS